jgi:hypothetical protein
MKKTLTAFLVLCLFIAAGCSQKSTYLEMYNREMANKASIPRMGYAIQAGAFANVDNAARYTDKLESDGEDAYYFLHDSGLYKVRIGNFSTYDRAKSYAESLVRKRTIEEFFIVRPQDYDDYFRPEDVNYSKIRASLVKTAEKYIGIPYRWGGESAKSGFDCSGLTMVTYKLNGLNLPRNSRAQFDSGKYVPKNKLQPGDLVFFATMGGNRVSHVGIYIGSNRFIHAPGRGKTVRTANLNNTYFRRTYVGARTYL